MLGTERVAGTQVSTRWGSREQSICLTPRLGTRRSSATEADAESLTDWRIVWTESTPESSEIKRIGPRMIPHAISCNRPRVAAFLLPHICPANTTSFQLSKSTMAPKSQTESLILHSQGGEILFTVQKNRNGHYKCPLCLQTEEVKDGLLQHDHLIQKIMQGHPIGKDSVDIKMWYSPAESTGKDSSGVW